MSGGTLDSNSIVVLWLFEVRGFGKHDVVALGCLFAQEDDVSWYSRQDDVKPDKS